MRLRRLPPRDEPMRTVNCWSRKATIWPRMTCPSFMRMVSASAATPPRARTRVSAASGRTSLKAFIIPPRGAGGGLHREATCKQRETRFASGRVAGSAAIDGLRGGGVARYFGQGIKNGRERGNGRGHGCQTCDPFQPSVTYFSLPNQRRSLYKKPPRRSSLSERGGFLLVPNLTAY